MKRLLIALPVVFFGLLGAPVHTVQHGPTLSRDLTHHSARPHLHHVIVQADDDTLDGLAGRGEGTFRHRLNGAVALDVNGDISCLPATDGRTTCLMSYAAPTGERCLAVASVPPS